LCLNEEENDRMGNCRERLNSSRKQAFTLIKSGLLFLVGFLNENGCKKVTLVYFRTSLPTVSLRARLSDHSQGIMSFGEELL
jgi:hypothetical protein